MKADPQYAPEHLALEAVRRLGPQARDWVADTRRRNPMAPTDEIAKMAIAKFINLARLSGATSGVAGLAGAVVDIGVLAWTQARMVLHIAAAYGADPTDPDRATELLVLQKIHKYAEGARVALAVAQGRERAGAMLSVAKTPLGRAFGQLGVKLTKMAGVRAAKRFAAKIVPGAAVVLGAWANSSATTELAGRAVAMYRGTGPIPLPPGPDLAAPPPHGQTGVAGPAQ
jgi:hypothetical protein